MDEYVVMALRELGWLQSATHYNTFNNRNYLGLYIMYSQGLARPWLLNRVRPAHTITDYASIESMILWLEEDLDTYDAGYMPERHPG